MKILKLSSTYLKESANYLGYLSDQIFSLGHMFNFCSLGWGSIGMSVLNCYYPPKEKLDKELGIKTLLSLGLLSITSYATSVSLSLLEQQLEDIAEKVDFINDCIDDSINYIANSVYNISYL